MNNRTENTQVLKHPRRKLTPQQVQRSLIAKRRQTLIRKSDELRRLGARVHLVIETTDRYHVYSSESSESWPPTADRLEKNYPIPLKYGPDCFTTRSSSGH
ncbi:hypothetical protein CEP52_014766 [Fusarium oligoseptatum]|uniref:MADS-box domain-containing protein n=1 Tax=Fusarium oligoseptatum TaxID=2604345 RepID=A0A428SJC0_9HYPO|nr:hypothetical protein CEP52_014766 [Fusarium oligoseptatum]